MTLVPDSHGRTSSQMGFDSGPFIHVGDLWDSYDIGFDRQKTAFLEWMDLGIKLGGKFLIGNHDYHYINLDMRYRCSGFQDEHALQIQGLMLEYIELFQAAIIYDETLITHAGVTFELWDRFYQPDLVTLCEIVNSYPKEMFYISPRNKGKDEYDGNLWLRPIDYKPIPYRQIVGHTFHSQPQLYHNMLVIDCSKTLDYEACFSTSQQGDPR